MTIIDWDCNVIPDDRAADAIRSLYRWSKVRAAKYESTLLGSSSSFGSSPGGVEGEATRTSNRPASNE